MSSRAAREFYGDILAAIAHAEEVADGKTLSDYKADRNLRRLLERLLMIITEATVHLTDEQKSLCEFSEWRAMRNLGNRIRHGYFTLQDEQMWVIVERDLPRLKLAVQKTLHEHFADDASE